MHALFDSIVTILVEFINQIGYIGIFIGMFLESTLVPIPSEVIMIPAGLAAAQGNFNIYAVTIAGITGNVLGAIFSYYLASSIGRPILLKIGKYFFVKEATIVKIENYFKNHGPISVFIGRLLPGFRHFISLPAGVAKMDIKLFFFYTLVGSTIWTTLLSMMGFLIGEQQEFIKTHLHELIYICAGFCMITILSYILYRRLSKV